MTGDSPPPRTAGPRRSEGVSRTEIIYRPSLFVLLAGLWLMAAPTVLHGAAAVPAASSWNKTVVGAVMATIAAVRVARPERTARLSLINVVLGAWLIAAPFFLGYHAAVGPAWNDVVVGAIVMMLAGVSWLAQGK